MITTREIMKKHSIAAGPMDGITTAMIRHGTEQPCSASSSFVPAFLLALRSFADIMKRSDASPTASSMNGSRNRTDGDLRISRFTA